MSAPLKTGENVVATDPLPTMYVMSAKAAWVTIEVAQLLTIVS